MTKVTVIIPYYQKKAGILRRALDSILRQQLAPNIQITIIVIDDASPIPAKTEIIGLNFLPPFHFHLVEQPNGGVAAARNTGLDNVPMDTIYLAFLDSDDIWSPTHLTSALSALDVGHDYYFSDHSRLGGHDSFFKMWGFSPPLLAHPLGGNLHEIDKDELTDAILQFAISHMSTVVFRWKLATKERFNPAYRLAGEDVMYLLQVAFQCSRCCYSTELQVTCADGINIWASRYNWDAPLHMAAQLCRLVSMQEIRKSLPLTRRSLSFASGIITQLRRYFAYMSIRELFKRGRPWPLNVNEMRRNDPTFWSWYPLCLLYVAVCYPLRLYTPKD